MNTADTRIQVRWNVRESAVLSAAQRNRLLSVLASRLTESGDLILACDTHRSQRRNRDEVAERLAHVVREALVPPRPRKKTRPSLASKRKRLEDKKRRSAVKQVRRKPAGDD